MKPKKADVEEMTEHYRRENRVAAIVTLKNPAARPVGSAMEKLARLVLGKDEASK